MLYEILGILNWEFLTYFDCVAYISQMRYNIKRTWRRKHLKNVWKVQNNHNIQYIHHTGNMVDDFNKSDLIFLHLDNIIDVSQ